jgi:hypothetical protein
MADELISAFGPERTLLICYADWHNIPMEVILFALKYTGPLLLAGLYVLGWLKLWSRPDFAFALIYAAGVFACFVFAGLFSPFRTPYVWSASGLYLSVDRFTLWGVVGALGFVLPAFGVVALRQRLNRSK